MLAMLDREGIERRVRALFHARKQGDSEGMLAEFSPNIVYEVVGSWDLYPFYGRREGIEAIRAMLLELAMEFENLGSTIHDILIDGERVAVRRTARLRHRGTNAIADVGIVDFLRFRNGLVIEISEYPDTATVGKLAGRLTSEG
jgi:ketosteroid isomerase-like protein